MQLKASVMTISAIGLLFLGACSSDNQPTNSASSPATPPGETQPSTAAAPVTSTAKQASGKNQGGQVIESGPYHLELVTGKETSGTHLDLFLQRGDTHEPILNAKVTAQVQLPDGTQQSLDMKYDAAEKHYAATLLSTAVGEYKVAILSDINGEKVNGRFSFKQ